MSNEAKIGIQVELAALRKQLAESGDLTGEQASRMVAALNKQMKAAEKAQLSAAKAAKAAREEIAKASGATKDFGDKAGQAGSTASKFAQALGIISPEAQQALMGIADLADGAEGLGAVSASTGASIATLGAGLVAVAAAAAPFIGQLVVMQREETEAAARAEFLAKHLHSLQAASRSLEDSLLAAAVATGKLSAEQGALLAVKDRAARAIEDFQQAQEGEIAAANEAYFAAEKTLSQLQALPEFLQVAADYYGGYSSAQREATTTLKALAKEELEHQSIVLEGADADEEALKAAEKKRKADEAARNATERRTEALRALNDEIQRESDLGRQNAATFAEVGEQQEALAEAAERAIATDRERIALDRQAAEATAARLLQERLAVSSTESAIEVAHADHKRAMSAIDAEAAAKSEDLLTREAATRAAAAKAAVELAKRTAEEARRAGLDMTNAIGGYVTQALAAGGDAAGDASAQAAATARSLEEQLAASEQHLTEAQKAELQKRAAAAKDAALEQFNTSKNLKLAEATAAAALAVINQLASNPGPAGVAAAIAAGAAGATSLAAIGATQLTLHKGGEVMAPDEVGVTARRNEFMLTPTGRATMGSDRELHAGNAGVSPRSAPTYVVTQYQHSRIATRYKEDGIKRNDPVSQAIQKRLGPVGME